MTIHGAAALVLDYKDLELDPEDAGKLSKAMQDVAKHYSVSVDPKKLAIVNLIGVAGSIYIAKFLTWKMQRTAEPKKAPIRVMPDRAAAPAPAQEMPRAATGGGPMAPSQIWEQSGILPDGYAPAT